MFTAYHFVADVVPAHRREGEERYAAGAIRRHVLSHRAHIIEYVRYDRRCLIADVLVPGAQTYAQAASTTWAI
jgi:hypothetical protein